MKMHTRAVILVAALQLVAVQAGVAAEPAGGDNAPVLHEVTVTATRRDESLQNIPVTVAVLSGQELEQMGANDFQDYARSVPGLSYRYNGPLGSRGARNYAIRGISGTDTVGFYIDESNTPILDPKLLDVERIEILRGPQSALYGSNSMGGTIRVLTNQPSPQALSGEVSASGSATAHGGGNYSVDGVLNVPMGDVTAVRIVAGHNSNSGFIDNSYDPVPGLRDRTVPAPASRTLFGIEHDYNSEKADTVRVTLKTEPVQGFTITPRFFYSDDRDANTPYYYSTLPPLEMHQYIKTPESERLMLGDLTAQYDSAKFQFVSTTTFFQRVYDSLDDVTQYFPLGPFTITTPSTLQSHIDDHIWTEDAHVLSKFGGPLDGLLGVFYQDAIYGGFQFWQTPTTPPVPNNLIFQYHLRQDTTQKAAYAELRYHLLPTLLLTGGIRRYDINVSSTSNSSGILGAGVQTGESHETGNRPEASLSWTATDNMQLYANYGKGFRPGGTNPPLPNTCGPTPARNGFQSDDVRSYEIGDKTTWFDHRLELNVSVYDMDWDNLQQSVALPTCHITVTLNTGKVTSRGAELEMRAVPVRNLSLDGSVTYAHTHLETDQPSIHAIAGDPVLWVPTWKYNLGVEYQVDLSDSYQGFTRVDWEREGDSIGDYGNRSATPPVAPFVATAYGTLGMHIGVQKQQFRVEIYGTNLTDQSPATNFYAFAAPPGTVRYVTIRPRTIGIRGSYSF